MLTFDKMKLVTSLDYITITDEDVFERKEKGTELLSLHFSMNFPFKLYLKVDYEGSELVIEFTGKVLGQNYSRLISMDTIGECLQNINALGGFVLDVEGIIHDSRVVSCDVTRDVDCEDIPSVTKFIAGNVRNRRKYTCRSKNNGNLIIEKNVDTPMYKRRLTIYDKHREMNMTKNTRYKEIYDIDEDTFEGKLRLEMNLGSMAQIRSVLGVADNELLSVLSSSADPITEFVEEILSDTQTSPVTPSSKKEYEASLVLQDCGFDLDAVEAKLRLLSGRSFHPQRDMAIYRDLLNREQVAGGCTKEKILGMIRGVSE